MAAPTPTSSPWLRAGLTVLAVLFFLAFLATNAVNNHLLKASYYTGVLDHAHAYDRAYNELAVDPSFSPQVNDLLGGQDFPVGEIAGAVSGVIAPDLLRTAVSATIERLVEYLKDNRSLDLSIDITDMLGLASGTPLGAIGGDIGGLIGGLPEDEADTYPEFLQKLGATVDLIVGQQRLPDAVPTYDYSRNQRAEIVSLILTRGKVNTDTSAGRDTRDTVTSAIADDDVESALRAVAPANVSEPPGNGSGEPDLSAVNDIVGAEFVTHVGDRYYLGPPPAVTSDIQDAFSIVHWVSWTSGWGEIVTAILVVALLAALAYLSRASRASALRWTGVPLIAAGAIGFFAWLIGRDIGRDRILDMTLGKNNTDIPESFQRLWRDVLDQAFTDLTPAIWVPALIALGIGIALVVASVMLPARSPAPD